MLPPVPLSWSAEIQKLEGHQGKITAITFSSDGSLIASASEDGTVRLWKASTGEESQRLLTDIREQSISLSPDSQFLTVISAVKEKSLMQLWNAQTGEKILERIGCAVGLTRATSPLAQLAAIVVENEMIEIWDFHTGSMKQKLRGRDEPIRCMAFSPEGQTVAALYSGGSARLWSTQSGKQTFELSLLEDEVSILSNASMALTPDGKSVAISYITNIKLYNLQTGEKTHELTSDRPWFLSITFSPDGQLIAASGIYAVVVWNTLTGQEIQRCGSHGETRSAMAFSPIGCVIASSSGGGTLRLVNIQHDDNSQKLDVRDRTVVTIRLSPDGQLAASWSVDGTVRLWNVSTGKERPRLECGDSPRLPSAFSSDSSVLATGHSDSTVRLWDVRTSSLMFTLNCEYLPKGMVFSPDGQTIAVITALGKVLLWNFRTGEQRILTALGAVTELVFSPNGKGLAVVSEPFAYKYGFREELVVWDVPTSKELHRFPSDRFPGICFSPDSRIVMSAQKIGLLLRDVQTGQEMQMLEWPPNAQVIGDDDEDEKDRFRFSHDSKSIQTRRGVFKLNWRQSLSLLEPLKQTDDPELNGRWIRHRGQDLLHLPHEYRGHCSYTVGDTLIIGQHSGDVSFFRIKASLR